MEKTKSELCCEALLKIRDINNARIQNVLDHRYEQAMREIRFEPEEALQKRDPEFPGLYNAIRSRMEENLNQDFSNYDTQDEKDELFVH